jgi:hypothetical protein
MTKRIVVSVAIALGLFMWLRAAFAEDASAAAIRGSHDARALPAGIEEADAG